jgi:hypothetical protein
MGIIPSYIVLYIVLDPIDPIDPVAIPKIPRIHYVISYS